MDEKQQKLASLFPRASKSFLDANPQLFASQPKQDLRPAVVDATRGKTEGHARIGLSIVMHRVRLLDPDNLVGSAKPLIDCLRTCHLIPDDSEKEISLQVAQHKVSHYPEQKTVVTIEYP